MKIRLSELRSIVREVIEEAGAYYGRTSPSVGTALPPNGSELDDFGPLKADNDTDDVDDYEVCAECGYDHSYEPQEAFEAHHGKGDRPVVGGTKSWSTEREDVENKEDWKKLFADEFEPVKGNEREWETLTADEPLTGNVTRLKLK